MHCLITLFGKLIIQLVICNKKIMTQIWMWIRPKVMGHIKSLEATVVGIWRFFSSCKSFICLSINFYLCYFVYYIIGGLLQFAVLKCFLKEVQVKAYRSQSWNCTQSYICQSKCGLAKWVEELTRIWQEIKHKWTQGWFACWMSVTIISLKGSKTFYFCWRSICLHLLTNVYFCFELLF